MKKIGIGFLGLGTVGQGVLEQVNNKSDLWKDKLGVLISPISVAVRSLEKKREVEFPPELLTTDSDSVVVHPEIDLVIELIGGVEEARRLTIKAFKNGKSVVSANKALICDHGPELLEKARENGVHYFFEASVAGGIPIIKVIQEAFVGNHVTGIQGILNGTSNYILTRMEREGIAYQVALKEAQALGYVEQDESLDLDGVDAAHKLVILAYLCFHRWFPLESLQVEGIRNIALEDIQAAAHLGYKIKLIATIKELPEYNEIICSVRPSLVPKTNNLASVDDVYNGIRIVGDIVGNSVLIGRGAGRAPTSSAVLSDIVDFCRRRIAKPILKSDQHSLASPEHILQPYYLRFRVEDKRGVLSEITHTLSEHEISISTIEQILEPESNTACIMMTTHDCRDANVQSACEEISKSPYLKSTIAVLPMLD
jgi:homoserine dehydrogenase